MLDKNRLREKYYVYLLKKYEKWVKLPVKIKLYCAFVIDQTQTILHPRESLCHM